MTNYKVVGRVFGAKGELLTGKTVKKDGDIKSSLFEKSAATRKPKSATKAQDSE